MTRNLRAFGLALVAMLAFGGFAAQGASAAESHSFNSSVNSTILTGTTEASNVDIFTATPGLDVRCHGTFRGTVTGAQVDTVTVHPTYDNCQGGVVVHTDGCNYIFDSDTTAATGHSAGQEHAAVSLECESSHWIEITRPGCWITFNDDHSGVEVNQSLHGVRYTNLDNHGPSSKKAITVTGTVKTIKYIVTGGSFCGLAGHAPGTYSNGTYDTKVEVTGYDDNSVVVTGTTTTGTTWHHTTQVDVFLSTPA